MGERRGGGGRQHLSGRRRSSRYDWAGAGTLASDRLARTAMAERRIGRGGSVATREDDLGKNCYWTVTRIENWPLEESGRWEEAAVCCMIKSMPITWLGRSNGTWDRTRLLPF